MSKKIKKISISEVKKILDVLTEYEERLLRENVEKRAKIFKIKAVFDVMSFEEDNEKLKNSIKSVSEIIAILPRIGKVVDEKISYILLIGTTNKKAFLKAIKDFKVKGGKVVVTQIKMEIKK